VEGGSELPARVGTQRGVVAEAWHQRRGSVWPTAPRISVGISAQAQVAAGKKKGFSFCFLLVKGIGARGHGKSLLRPGNADKEHL